jgi:ubiquinol-cytochrome c reductase iron-sulfur subunit
MSDMRTEESPERPPGRYTALVALSFVVSAVSSLALTVVYALGGQVQLEGVLLGGALGGLASGFVLWGKHFMPEGPFVEERPPMPSPAPDRTAFTLDFYRGGEGIRRRTFLGRLLLGALAALGVAALFPVRSLGPAPQGTLFRTAWRRGMRVVTPDGEPVAVADLPVGGILTVFPEGETDAADSQTVLVRVDPTRFRPLPGRQTWSPEGYLAYSKICTHAGCPVGLYEQASNRLFCPCHQSEFDVLVGARPTTGPATRPLPQLPLEVDSGGFLTAQGDFSEPVGPGFWNLP